MCARGFNSSVSSPVRSANVETKPEIFDPPPESRTLVIRASAEVAAKKSSDRLISPITVSATLGLATAIITESALSFLGLGFPPDFPTWGRLLYDAVDQMVLYPSRVILPGIFISLTVLCVNYIGDGLRDAMDPRIRGR